MAAKDGHMDPVFLIHGEDDLKREAMVKRLLKRFQDMGDIDFNSDNFLGSSASANDIIASCNTLPFLSPYRLVMVKDVEKLPKDDQKALADYLKSPCESTVLALVAVKLPKTSVLYKAVDKNYPKCIIDCAPKSRKELPLLVQRMAQTYGASIAPDAIDLLISYVGESTVRLDAELSKLAASLHDSNRIGVEDVDRMVTRTTQAKPWSFTDALANRNAQECLRLLDRMDDQSWLGLLSLSVTRIRELMITKSLEKRGEAWRLAEQLGKKDWQVRSHRSCAARFSEEELADALDRAAQAEMAMKSGSDQRLQLELWTLDTCLGVKRA